MPFSPRSTWMVSYVALLHSNLEEEALLYPTKPCSHFSTRIGLQKIHYQAQLCLTVMDGKCNLNNYQHSHAEKSAFLFQKLLLLLLLFMPVTYNIVACSTLAMQRSREGTCIAMTIGDCNRLRLVCVTVNCKVWSLVVW
jgi:hypothetical protein